MKARILFMKAFVSKLPLSKVFSHPRLVLLLVALFIPPIASAQITDMHPRGLFDATQPGLEDYLARTTADADGLRDKFHFALSSSVRYDDNIFLASAMAQSDVVFSVSPTLKYSSAEDGTAANTLSIIYTPSFRVYADHAERNTVDHSLKLKLGKRMPKTRIGFDMGYQKTSGSDRFVSGTVDRDSLRTGLSVSHTLTGKTRLDVDLFYEMDDFSSAALFDRETSGVNVALMYQATGKITVGPYMSYGMTDMSTGSSDHDFYSYGARVTYEVSGKTAITGSLGSSVRSFSGTGASGDYSSAEWEMGASHALSGKTNIRASIFRKAKASYNLADSGYLATGLVLSGTYQASERSSFYTTVTFENDDYFKASAAGTTQDNDYHTLTLGSRYRWSNGLTLGADVTYREKQSNTPLNDYDNLSFGLNASYNFW